jgi:hypothetical protein
VRPSVAQVAKVKRKPSSCMDSLLGVERLYPFHTAIDSFRVTGASTRQLYQDLSSDGMIG